MRFSTVVAQDKCVLQYGFSQATERKEFFKNGMRKKRRKQQAFQKGSRKERREIKEACKASSLHSGKSRKDSRKVGLLPWIIYKKMISQDILQFMQAGIGEIEETPLKRVY